MTREEMAEWLRNAADSWDKYGMIYGTTGTVVGILNRIAVELEGPLPRDMEDHLRSDPGPRPADRIFILPDGSGFDLDEIGLVRVNHGDVKDESGNVALRLTTGVSIYMKSNTYMSFFCYCDTHDEAKDLARRISTAANSRMVRLPVSIKVTS